MTYAKGQVYHGNFRGGYREGFGLMKYPNKDEYDGQWIRNKKNGEGIFKEAETGKIKRIKYEEDKVIEVLEEIFEIYN